jgi:hypothetical protein
MFRLLLIALVCLAGCCTEGNDVGRLPDPQTEPETYAAQGFKVKTTECQYLYFFSRGTTDYLQPFLKALPIAEHNALPNVKDGDHYNFTHSMDGKQLRLLYDSDVSTMRQKVLLVEAGLPARIIEKSCYTHLDREGKVVYWKEPHTHLDPWFFPGGRQLPDEDIIADPDEKYFCIYDYEGQKRTMTIRLVSDPEIVLAISPSGRCSWKAYFVNDRLYLFSGPAEVSIMAEVYCQKGKSLIFDHSFTIKSPRWNSRITLMDMCPDGKHLLLVVDRDGLLFASVWYYMYDLDTGRMMYLGRAEGTILGASFLDPALFQNVETPPKNKE